MACGYRAAIALRDGVDAGDGRRPDLKRVRWEELRCRGLCTSWGRDRAIPVC